MRKTGTSNVKTESGTKPKPFPKREPDIGEVVIKYKTVDKDAVFEVDATGCQSGNAVLRVGSFRCYGNDNIYFKLRTKDKGKDLQFITMSKSEAQRLVCYLVTEW